MYHRHNVVRRVVILLFLLQIVGMSTGLAVALPDISYDKLCVITRVPLSLAIFA